MKFFKSDNKFLMLFIVTGLPGTGKSTICRIIKKKYNAVILNADEFRKGLFDTISQEKDKVYPEYMQDIPYNAIFITAKYLINNKKNVIIDASLYSNKLIKKAKTISKDSITIQTICKENIIKKRLEKRTKKSKKYSAGLKVYEYMRTKTEKLKNIDLILDTSKKISEKDIAIKF